MKIKISKSLLESLDKNEVGNLYIGTDGRWIDPKKFAIHFNNHVQARVKINPETDKVVSTHGVDTQINYNNSLPNSKVEDTAGSGETSGTIKD